MAPATKPRILCVDDEPNVLEGLRLNLGRRFDMTVADSGAKGLERMRQTGPFAVVVSDMRMPEMNGAEFLSQARKLDPQTVRLLLTGQTDLDSAITAVNEGRIFRFLSKPCPPDQLVHAVEDAVEQYRLVTAERELLEQTLMGSLATLGDILALAHPEAFGRAMRLREYVRELSAISEVPDRWQVEAAAMLSQIGYITLNAETMAKVNRSQTLSAEEQKQVARVPQATEQLLAHIPRLEGVRAILSGSSGSPEKSGAKAPTESVALGVRLLKLALDFDRLDRKGLSLEAAIADLKARVDPSDREILEQFTILRLREGGREGVEEIPLSLLQAGMVLMEDVVMKSGVLLAPRGYVVTETFVERARNSQAGAGPDLVRCSRPRSQPETQMKRSA